MFLFSTGTIVGLIVYTICSYLYYSLYIEELLSLGPAVKAGATEVSKFTRQKYMRLLRSCATCTRFLYAFERKESVKSTFIRINNLLESLRLDSSDGRLRKQPFCILLEGPPGSGKTTAAIDIAIQLLKAKYGHAYADEIVTINETDAFQSEFRTSHKVVIFDDIGSEHPEFCQKNPYHKVIDFVNNINKTSLNPNVEMKGNVYINPDLVIMTSNLKSLHSATTYMQCAAAILRRINIGISVHRDEKGQSFKTVDFSMVHPANNNVYAGERIAPVTEEFSDKEVMYSCLRHDFLKHLSDQEQFIKAINDNFTSNDALLSDHVVPFYYRMWDAFKSRLFARKIDIITDTPRDFLPERRELHTVKNEIVAQGKKHKKVLCEEESKQNELLLVDGKVLGKRKIKRKESNLLVFKGEPLFYNRAALEKLLQEDIFITHVMFCDGYIVHTSINGIPKVYMYSTLVHKQPSLEMEDSSYYWIQVRREPTEILSHKNVKNYQDDILGKKFCAFLDLKVAFVTHDYVVYSNLNDGKYEYYVRDNPNCTSDKIFRSDNPALFSSFFRMRFDHGFVTIYGLELHDGLYILSHHNGPKTKLSNIPQKWG